MTAIIAGRIPQANFIVVDAMVQTELNINNYKECRLQDKISDIDLSEQYLVLMGEQLIGDGAELLNYWSLKKRIKYNLFDINDFNNILELALRYRKYHVDINKFSIIEQDRTDVYVVGRSGLKYYGIKYRNSKFEIIDEKLFPDNYILLNYGGETQAVPVPEIDVNIFDFCISELNNEHERRKMNKFSNGSQPLDYDFEGKFSSAILFTRLSKQIERTVPFDFPTDVFLSFAPEWDYVTNDDFRFLPTNTNERSSYD